MDKPKIQSDDEIVVYVPRSNCVIHVGEIFNRLMDIKRLENSGKGPETVRPVPLLEQNKSEKNRIR